MTMLSSSLPLAAAPLFGNQWLALLFCLALIAAFVFAVAGLGRWLAATHPEEPAKAVSPAVVEADDAIPPEVVAAIAAAVVAMFGSRARIVELAKHPPSVEALMQQWSLEGRRQIYSSHKIR